MTDCGKNVDRFCVMCGRFIAGNKVKNFTKQISASFCQIFGIEPLTLENSWVPKVICGSCEMRVRFRATGNMSTAFFHSPMIWQKSVNHPTDCYFCQNYKFGLNSKSPMKYVETASVRFPVLIQDLNQNIQMDYGDDSEQRMKSESHYNAESMEVDEGAEDSETASNFNEIGSINQQETNETSDEDNLEESDEEDFKSPSGKLNQDDLNDLCRDLKLSKNKSELLASRLKEFGCLEKGTKISVYRNRDLPYSAHFKKEQDLVYCHDIGGLMKKFDGYTYSPKDWRLFVDSSKRSLEPVLLNQGNKFASIPIAHSTVMGESYQNMDSLLDKVKYKQHDWKICTDLKVVSILLGQQPGNTKFPCFICEWDSRDRNSHYIKKD